MTKITTGIFVEVKEQIKGILYQSLKRSNKQIRQERGEALAEQLETSFRRNIEDFAL